MRPKRGIHVPTRLACLALLFVLASGALGHDGLPPYPESLGNTWEMLQREAAEAGRKTNAFPRSAYMSAARSILGPGPHTLAGFRNARQEQETAADLAWALAAMDRAGVSRAVSKEAAVFLRSAMSPQHGQGADAEKGTAVQRLSLPVSLPLVLALDALHPGAPESLPEPWRVEIERRAQPDPGGATGSMAAWFWLEQHQADAASRMDTALGACRGAFDARGVPSGLAGSAIDRLRLQVDLACLLELGYTGMHRYVIEEMLTRGVRTLLIQPHAGIGTGREPDMENARHCAACCALFELRARACARSGEVQEARLLRTAARQCLEALRARTGTGHRLKRDANESRVAAEVASMLAVAWRFAEDTIPVLTPVPARLVTHHPGGVGKSRRDR